MTTGDTCRDQWDRPVALDVGVEGESSRPHLHVEVSEQAVRIFAFPDRHQAAYSHTSSLHDALIVCLNEAAKAAQSVESAARAAVFAWGIASRGGHDDAATAKAVDEMRRVLVNYAKATGAAEQVLAQLGVEHEERR